MYAQRRIKSACASAQSDQSLLPTWRNFASLAIQNARSEHSDQTARMRPANIQIRLRECAQRIFRSDCANAPSEYSDQTARMRPENIQIRVRECAQRIFRSDCANAPSEYSDQTARMRPANIQIRLHECVVWSEYSLGAYVRRYIFWRCGSIIIIIISTNFVVGNICLPFLVLFH